MEEVAYTSRNIFNQDKNAEAVFLENPELVELTL